MVGRNTRETTLRQLIYNCNKELLKGQGLTRTELHELTTWVLSNAAISKFTHDEVYILNGNPVLGVGLSNFDKEVKFPRYLSYELGKADIFNMLSNTGKSFRLRSFDTFSELENYLTYATNEVIIVIDGKIVEYEKRGKKNWGYEIIWGCDTYIITYVLDDMEQKEIIKSKLQLQNRLVILVQEGAKEIQAYNIIEGERVDFEVHKRVYTTRPTPIEENLRLTWSKDINEEDEEEEMVF